MTDKKLILVTGATGYVGGRLVPKLREAGYRVRCLVRDPSRLQGCAWLNKVEVAQGDALNHDELVKAKSDPKGFSRKPEPNFQEYLVESAFPLAKETFRVFACQSNFR